MSDHAAEMSHACCSGSVTQSCCHAKLSPHNYIKCVYLQAYIPQSPMSCRSLPLVFLVAACSRQRLLVFVEILVYNAIEADKSLVHLKLGYRTSGS